MVLLFSFISAMFITMILIPPLMRNAQMLRIVDVPEERKVHHNVIPRIGGIAMVVGALLPMIVWIHADKTVISLIAGMGVIFLFGILDDRQNLDYRLKFLGQAIAVLVVMVYGDIAFKTVPLMDGHPLPGYIALSLTFLFLLGITNAINLSDGLDGLAGGMSLLSLGVISLLAYQSGEFDIMLISIAILGSVLGFLRFNTHPARVFMGDGGSQFLGFSLGVLVLMLTQGETASFSTALPLLILGLPMLDTVMVMAQRFREGRSPFEADKNHIHHRLLNLGLSHYEAVFCIYVIQSSLVLTAYFFRYASDGLIVGVFIFVSLLIVVFLYQARIKHWHYRYPGTDNQPLSFLGNLLARLNNNADGQISRLAASITIAMVAMYLLAVTFLTSAVTLDLAMMMLILCVVQMLSLLLLNKRAFSWIERAGIYVLITTECYLGMDIDGVSKSIMSIADIYFILLAVGVVVGLRFSPGRAFKITTLDFLVIFAAFVVPNLPGQFARLDNFGEFLVRLIILFYAIELIMTQISSHAHLNMIRVVIASISGWFALYGLMNVELAL